MAREQTAAGSHGRCEQGKGRTWLDQVLYEGGIL